MASQPSSWWDPGRFLKTLSYFGAIPFLSDLEWFQNMVGSRVNPFNAASSPSQTRTVWVVGSQQQLRQQIVQKLAEHGYTAVQPDLQNPPAHLRAIVCCPTADENLEILSALQQLKPHLQQPSRTLFDFTQPNPQLREVWGALDDVVMGGVSESQLLFESRSALFTGNVSTANSGGFASVRTRNFEPPLNLSDAEGLELRVKGDGNRYKLLLRSESAWDGVAYANSFDTEANTWMTVRLPFAELVPVFRARTVQTSPIDSSRLYAFQIMLSKFEYDGALNPNFNPGTFRLEIEAIRAYGKTMLPQLVVLSPKNILDEGVHQSTIPYAVIRYGALTETSGGKSLTLEPGGMPYGFINPSDLAEMAVRSLSAPQATDATFAIAEGTGICPANDWDCLFSRLR